MKILEQIQSLISIEKRAENITRVHLPVLYADGENVCIEIIENPHSFFVTDCGFGVENAVAQLMNVSENEIEKIGKNVSKLYGLKVSKKYTKYELQERNIRTEQNNKYNGVIYLNEVSLENLNGAIMLIANASQFFSQKIVSENILIEERSLRNLLDERLKKVFKDSYDKKVKKDVEIAGRSTKSYKISFVISGDKIRYLEPVSSNLNSISPLFLKYSDIHNEDISKESVVSNIKRWDAPSLELIKNVCDKVQEIERFVA